MEQKQAAFIPKDSIIIRDPEIQLQSFNDVTNHLKQRQGLFFSRLGSLLRSTDVGWERIIGPRRNIKKQTTTGIDPRALLTAKTVCDFTNAAVADALSRIAPTIQFDIVMLQTRFDAENWRKKNPPTAQKDSHAIIRATGSTDGEIRYIDAAYAQINHTRAGHIIIIPSEALDAYYGGPERKCEPISEDFTPSDEAVKYFVEESGFRQEEYEKLVKTLT